MEINASYVILDNVWLWRADVQNAHRVRDCNHSLVVNGHDVTAYGLAAEHVQSDNTVWNGERGQLFFYQAELDGLAHKPGDKTPDFGSNGVSGYRVNAKQHSAMGVGVYCWFSSPGIVVESAVKVLHQQTEAGIVCPFQWVWENANTPPKGNSTIEHAILVAKSDDDEQQQPLQLQQPGGDGGIGSGNLSFSRPSTPPAGNCPSPCFCGASCSAEMINVPYWCSLGTREDLFLIQFPDLKSWPAGFTGWDQKHCECIVNKESANGDAHACNRNADGTTDVGPWQINSNHWDDCPEPGACHVSSNLICAMKIFSNWGNQPGANTWTKWMTCGGCGCCGTK